MCALVRYTRRKEGEFMTALIRFRRLAFGLLLAAIIGTSVAKVEAWTCCVGGEPCGNCFFCKIGCEWCAVSPCTIFDDGTCTSLMWNCP